MVRIPTTYIQLVGGLGSQFGGYFFGKYLEIHCGHSIVYDTSELDRGLTRHGVSLESLALPGIFANLRTEKSWVSYISRRFKFAICARASGRFRPRQMNYHTAKEVGWSPIHETLSKGTQIRGEFFTSRYYFACKKTEPDFLPALIGPTQEFEDEFHALSSVPFIAVHVRRGDYVGLSKTFGILDRGYFEDALAAIKNSGLEFDRVLVFSDDVFQSQELLKGILLEREVVFLGGTLSADPIHSFLLMSLATAHVVSNSSYSLWAALISETSKMVIAPDPWFRNLAEPNELLPRWVIRVPAKFVD